MIGRPPPITHRVAALPPEAHASASARALASSATSRAATAVYDDDFYDSDYFHQYADDNECATYDSDYE